MLTQTAVAVFLITGQFELGAPQLDTPAAFPPGEPAAAGPEFPATAPIRSILELGSPVGTAPPPSDNVAALAAVDPRGVDSTVALLRDALQRECQRPLAGQPVALATVLAASTQRAAAAGAYWQLATAAATYRLCVHETDFLLGLAEPRTGYQQAMLAALQAAAKADEARARLDVLRAQQALLATVSGALAERVDYAGRVAPQPVPVAPSNRPGGPPLPADLPFVGVYETHHETWQARGLATEQLAAIHATLPVLHELLRRQADAVFASETAVNELQQAYGSGAVPLAEVLVSFRQLQRQRREFLASVLDYNDAIVRYAFAVASPALPVGQVVGMLIEGSGGERAQRSVLAGRRDANPIRPVANEEPIPATTGTGPTR